MRTLQQFGLVAIAVGLLIGLPAIASADLGASGTLLGATVSEKGRYVLSETPTVFAKFCYSSGVEARLTSSNDVEAQVPWVKDMKAQLGARNTGTAIGNFRAGLWKRAWAQVGDEIRILEIKTMTVRSPQGTVVSGDELRFRTPAAVAQYVAFDLTDGDLLNLSHSLFSTITLSIEYVAGRDHQKFLIFTFGSKDITARTSEGVPFRLITPRTTPDNYKGIKALGLSPDQLWLYDHLLGTTMPHGVVDQDRLKQMIAAKGLRFRVEELPQELGHSVSDDPAPRRPIPGYGKPTSAKRAPARRATGENLSGNGFTAEVLEKRSGVQLATSGSYIRVVSPYATKTRWTFENGQVREGRTRQLEIPRSWIDREIDTEISLDLMRPDGQWIRDAATVRIIAGGE